MKRMSKGNYKRLVLIRPPQRWHKNYGDGYKILLDGKLKHLILRKFTNVEY